MGESKRILYDNLIHCGSGDRWVIGLAEMNKKGWNEGYDFHGSKHQIHNHLSF